MQRISGRRVWDPSFQREFLETVDRHGIARALFAVSMRALNRFTLFKILNGLCLERPNPAYLRASDGYDYGFPDKDALLVRCLHAEYDLSEAFVEEAWARGDRCFALWDRGVLASYAWYSNRATEICDNLMLDFDHRYVYAYKGFTRADYRGRRLHGIGRTLALEQYQSRGFRGFVSYVAATNLDSLKSLARIGYRNCGRIYVAGMPDHLVIIHSAECKEHGFVVTRPDAAPVVGPASSFDELQEALRSRP